MTGEDIKRAMGGLVTDEDIKKYFVLWEADEEVPAFKLGWRARIDADPHARPKQPDCGLGDTQNQRVAWERGWLAADALCTLFCRPDTCQRQVDDQRQCGKMPVRYSHGGIPLCAECADEAVTGGHAFPGFDLFEEDPSHVRR